MFKELYSFEDRSGEAERIREKHPDRVPVICEKSPNDTLLPKINRVKYLVPCDLVIAQFIYIIRKRINIEPENAIFLFVKGNIPLSSELVASVYEKDRDEDGFLYVTYSGENTFG
tara:strand:- start:602 stop:946 length:345 start_codon:yes stop_codon:yes gene_type:complete